MGTIEEQRDGFVQSLRHGWAALPRQACSLLHWQPACPDCWTLYHGQVSNTKCIACVYRDGLFGQKNAVQGVCMMLTSEQRERREAAGAQRHTEAGSAFNC